MPTRTKKPLSWFKTNAQVRSGMKESAVREMGESLKENGQLQDLAALSDGTLIFGHRRLAGALLVSLKELWVQVYDEPLTPAQITVMQLVENMQKEDLTSYDQWQGCMKLLELEPGLTNKDLSERLHKDPSTMTRIMSVSRVVPAWQEALKARAVGISDVYAAAKVSERDQHELLAAKLGGASRDELEQHRRKRNGKRNGSSCKIAEAKCELPGGAFVVIRTKAPMLAPTLSTIAEMLADALKRARKGVDEGYDVKTWEAVQRDKAKGA